MSIIKYILYFIVLLLTYAEARTQSIPWKVIPTGSNHTIFIKSSVTPTVEGESLTAGDVIGVFYDSAGTLACAGYAEWANVNTFIVAYGEDGTNKGFKTHEVFTFKIWRKAADCIIGDVSATYISGGVVTHTNTYAENGISELGTLTGVSHLKAENFAVQITHATCIAGGKILIKVLAGDNSTGMKFLATAISSGETFSSVSNEIVELPEGEYRLTIIDYNCSIEWPEALMISKDLNCNFPVISPNRDGIAEDYYIPYNGVARIYDRAGVLVVHFPVPATWNATDSSGRPLPMGTYIIVCEGQKEIMVTVVR